MDIVTLFAWFTVALTCCIAVVFTVESLLERDKITDEDEIWIAHLRGKDDYSKQTSYHKILKL